MSITETSLHHVRRKATCDLPEQRVYFKNEQRGCYPIILTTPLFGDAPCPPGWTQKGFTSGSEFGANCPGSVFEVLPICEKTTFTKSKAECCLSNDGSDFQCAPKACTTNQDDPSCFAAIKTFCLDTPGNLQRKPECQVWARKNNNRTDVVSAVRNFCQGRGVRSPGYTTEFCSCINATETALCTDENCFAKKFPELRAQSDCIADQCRKAKPGVFVPNDKPCATVCSNTLNFQGSQITAEGAIKISSVCNFTPAQTQQLAKIANIDPKLLIQSSGGQGSGGGIDIEQPQPGGGGGAGNANSVEKTGINREFQGVPIWGWILIALAIIIVIVAIIAALAKGVPKARDYYYQQRQNERNQRLPYQ